MRAVTRSCGVTGAVGRFGLLVSVFLAGAALSPNQVSAQGHAAAPERPTTHAGSWSRDGSQMLYGSEESGSRQIWTMNVDGSDKLRLSQNDATEGFAHFTPDGRTIVFVSDLSGNSDIWSMASDGSERRQLTDTPEDEVMPRVSPDGRLIFFSRGAAPNRPKSIYRMTIDGADEVRLSQESNQIYPSLSPVDRRLLTAGNVPGAPSTRIYIRATETAEPVVLAEHVGIASYNPDWSPDGEWIAFVSQTERSITTAAIWLARADDSEVRLLVEFPEGAFGPRWSPDGLSISFKRGWTEHIGLFRINVDGTELTQLTNSDWPTPGG